MAGEEQSVPIRLRRRTAEGGCPYIEQNNPEFAAYIRMLRSGI
jgi:hypothetical protein